MYRVMIVDDEEPVLDSFTFIIEKYVADFELCAKARTGFEAEQLIKELKPDLVFMDIQMPGINGIEVIRRVKDLFPDTVFLLATAYERFDIARKAIQLGVFSYLVKPISKTKFIDELEKVKTFLDLKREEISDIKDSRELIEKSRTEQKNEFLSELMWKNPTPESWAEFSRLFSFKSERAAVFIIGGNARLDAETRQRLYEKITEKLQFKYFILSTLIGDKLLLFIPEEQQLVKLITRLRTIIDSLPETFALGDGGIRHFSELKQSCAEAWRPFTDEPSESGSMNDSGRISTVDEAFKAIITADRNEAENIFNNFWLNRFQTDSFIVAKSKLAVLFNLLIREINRNVLLSNNFDIEPSEEIMPLESIAEWENWAGKAGKVVLRMIEDSRNRNYPIPLVAALGYIAENYDKPLQLSLVAEECRVSGSYLSRLFSEHLDYKFIDYLNRYRINKALIDLENGKSVKEAAYRSGYQDPNYFSRVFRKFMGVNPSEYDKRSFEL